MSLLNHEQPQSAVQAFPVDQAWNFLQLRQITEEIVENGNRLDFNREGIIGKTTSDLFLFLS